MKIGEDNMVRAPKSPDGSSVQCTSISSSYACGTSTDGLLHQKDKARWMQVEAMRCYRPSLSNATSSSRRPSILEGNDQACTQHPASNIQHLAPSTHDPMASMQISVGRAPSSSPWQAQHCARMCDRRWVR